MADFDTYCTIINENDESANQPNEIILPLKEHQLKLLNKCIETENNLILINDGDKKYHMDTKMGVIGDTVGSGKSMVCLSLATYPPFNAAISKHTFSSELINVNQKGSKSKTFIDTNVIVVPHNVFAQWVGYIEDYTTIDAEYAHTAASLNKLKFDKQIILVSSSMHDTFAKVSCHNYHVSRVFYDEADSINLPNCKKINAQFYWFVTSSIRNLLQPKGTYRQWDYTTNRYLPKTVPGISRNGFIKDTFKSIVDLYKPFKKSLFLKNSDELIKKSFSLNVPNVTNLNCKNTKILSILNNLVSEDIQQMICANNIEGAIKAMNVEKTDETNLIKIVAHQFYDEIENKKVDLDAVYKKKYKNKDKQQEDIMKIQKQIGEIECKIQNMQNRIKESNMDPITYEPIENPTIVKCCTQVFDFESITLYLTTSNNPKCPMCRTDITRDSLVIVTDRIEDEEEETKEDIEVEHKFEDNEKDVNLTHLLTNMIGLGSRIIIFSEYYETFSVTIELCNKTDIDCRVLKGNSNVIKKILEWYNNTDNITKILFLNARHAGAGLNLQSTSDLIIYHKMTKELEIQVIGRANRFGRVGTLNIWKLLYETEV